MEWPGYFKRKRITKPYLPYSIVNYTIMKKIIFVLGAAAVFTSCSKNNASDSQGPVITLSSPSNNQVFTAGQTVIVASAFTDQDMIKQTQIHVVNKSSNADVLHVEDHPGAVSARLTGSFSAVAGITYKIEVEAIDIAGNESKVEIVVTAK
jgi:hypothetical protein